MEGSLVSVYRSISAGCAGHVSALSFAFASLPPSSLSALSEDWIFSLQTLSMAAPHERTLESVIVNAMCVVFSTSQLPQCLLMHSPVPIWRHIWRLPCLDRSSGCYAQAEHQCRNPTHAFNVRSAADYSRRTALQLFQYHKIVSPVQERWRHLDGQSIVLWELTLQAMDAHVQWAVGFRLQGSCTAQEQCLSIALKARRQDRHRHSTPCRVKAHCPARRTEHGLNAMQCDDETRAYMTAPCMTRPHKLLRVKSWGFSAQAKRGRAMPCLAHLAHLCSADQRAGFS